MFLTLGMTTYQALRERNKGADSSEFFFELANSGTVRYRGKAGKTLTVQQDRNIDDCTGGIIWETAYLLATYLEAQGGLAKRRVLEVGAGCGLLGLVLATHGAEVLLTEAQPAMSNLRRNVKAAGKECKPTPRAMQLRWESEDDL